MFKKIKWGGGAKRTFVIPTEKTQKTGKESSVEKKSSQQGDIMLASPHSSELWHLENLQSLIPNKQKIQKVTVSGWSRLLLPRLQKTMWQNLPERTSTLLLQPDKVRYEQYLVSMLGRILADELRRPQGKTGLALPEETPEKETVASHRLVLDSRERSLCSLLGGLPFVCVETLPLADIVFRTNEEDQVLFERKRADDLYQGIVSSKFMQQRSRLVEVVRQSQNQQRVVVLHESPAWACHSNDGLGLPHNKFLKALKPRAPGKGRKPALSCEELNQSFLVSTVLKHQLPVVDTAHVYHTALLLLDFYRLWVKDQSSPSNATLNCAEEQRRLAVSKAKKQVSKTAGASDVETVAMLAVTLGAPKAVAVQKEFKTVSTLAALASQDRRGLHTRLANIEYGEAKPSASSKKARKGDQPQTQQKPALKRRKIGPGTAETFLKKMGW